MNPINKIAWKRITAIHAQFHMANFMSFHQFHQCVDCVECWCMIGLPKQMIFNIKSILLLSQTDAMWHTNKSCMYHSLGSHIEALACPFATPPTSMCIFHISNYTTSVTRLTNGIGIVTNGADAWPATEYTLNIKFQTANCVNINHGCDIVQ